MNIHVDDNNEVLLGVQNDEIDLRAGDTINIGTSDYEDLTNKPSIEGVELVGDVSLDDLGVAYAEDIPTDVSELNNDAGYISAETDPTVPAWAKAPNKPTYTASEVHALPDTTEIPTLISDLENDEGFITENDIPPEVTDLGNIDPADYEDDLEVFFNTLLDNGEYKFVWEDGDDFEYFVEIQSLVENGNGYVLQRYWYTEEGAKYQYNRYATLEDGDFVDSDFFDYMTSSDANIAFATKNHSHYVTVTKAMTVWDYCDSNDFAFDNTNPFVYYSDTINDKNYVIERHTVFRQPHNRFQLVRELGDPSHFYQRQGIYSGGVITYDDWKEFVSKDSLPFFVGTSSTAAGTGEKAVTCPEFKASDLKAGTIITVTFSNANSAAVGDLKLNVNSTGAKNIKVNSSGTLSNLGDKGYLKASTYQFYYSGTYWVLTGYDTNTNTIGYNIRTNALQLPLKTYCGRYRICFTAADGEHFVPANSSTSTSATASKTVTTEKIDPWGRIIYYTTTTGVNADGVLGATYMYSQYYTVTLGYSFNRTGAALTLTAQKPVYVKCTPQTDGSAIIDASTPFVQALPTTNDGSIYIFLGIATAATTIEMTLEHPVYYHDGTRIRLWT